MIEGKRSGRLTPRDVLFLSELYRNVMLTIPQVMERVFPGKAKSTALNRLGKLERMGLVRRRRVPEIEIHAPGPGFFVLFEITKTGIRALKQWHPEREFRDEPIKIHGWNVHHDVRLVDVMRVLEMKFLGSRVVHGRHWQSESGSASVVPDALFYSDSGAKKPVAVELELTPKSEKRYREIVLRYRLAQDFSSVLYVTQRKEVRKKLSFILGHELEAFGTGNSRFQVLELTSLFPKNTKKEPSNE